MHRARLLLVTILSALVLLFSVGFAGPPAGANTACGPACDNVTGDRVQLATEIGQYVAQGRFEATAWLTRNDIYDQEIAPIAANQPKPGCEVDTRILQTIVIVLQNYGSATISELNRKCPDIKSDVSCKDNPGSPHCTDPAVAIDFTSVGATKLAGGDESKPFLRFLDTFLPRGSGAGQVYCRSTISLSNITRQFDDDCTHQHIDLRNITDPITIDSASVQGPIAGSTIAATHQSDPWPDAYVNNGGNLFQIHADSTGWHTLPLGVTVATNATLTAVYKGGTWPELYVNNNGTLVAVLADASGWHAQTTGITGLQPGTSISGVDMGGTWPQIYINDGGSIKAALGYPTGWQLVPLQISVVPGSQLSAVRVQPGDQWPQVIVNNGGHLTAVVGAASGWSAAYMDQLTVAPSANISAVAMGTQWPQVMVNDGGAIYQVVGSAAGWSKGNTQLVVPAGGLAAVNMGGTWPQAVVNTGNVLTQLVADPQNGWRALPMK